jgi:hypothetical protein
MLHVDMDESIMHTSISRYDCGAVVRDVDALHCWVCVQFACLKCQAESRNFKK